MNRRDVSGTRLRARSRVPEAWQGLAHRMVLGARRRLTSSIDLVVAIPGIESLVLSFNVCRLSYCISQRISFATHLATHLFRNASRNVFPRKAWLPQSPRRHL
jgi:hypothetical protein